MEEKTTETQETLSHQVYLQSLAGELMADETWPFPPQLRFFLVSNLDWTLLGL